MTSVDLGLPTPPPVPNRRRSRRPRVGTVSVGGDAPVSVQTMTTTSTADVDATFRQIAEVTAAGCDIVRVAVPSADDADALPRITAKSPVPVIVTSTSSAIEVRDKSKVVRLSQTTRSVNWTMETVEALDTRFPQVSGPLSGVVRCATHNRQSAVQQISAADANWVQAVSPAGITSVALVNGVLRRLAAHGLREGHRARRNGRSAPALRTAS
ncbi:flavodoxin-dependent (E)-4-hydroxy-3-methylbut-2-enyl-diphosphate synthase [Streptomyces sp. 4F14]|uniref:flavodoxin-dependent (E)-4-hydroxy-3-methylbut-2-enyl-diphosphate synthase n=1 Tax=Streptomyces sp. 4F14 TaxID=3394380 RepID=UPI003A86E9BE